MKRFKSLPVIINALLFQLCWYLAIFTEWYWAVIPLVIMAIHFFCMSSHRWRDIQMVLVIAFMGITIDTLLKLNGVYQFNPQDLLLTERSIPIWLCILWVSFAMTLSSSLKWLIEKGAWFALACAIAGPVSYWVGRQNGVVMFSDSVVWILSLEWMLVGLLAVKLINPSVFSNMKSRVMAT